MKEKLVALDMDGTLLDSQKRLPEDFIPWVKSHPQIQTVIASGRQYYSLLNTFSEIADQLIFLCDNGGFVFENGKAVYQNVISDENLQKCLAYIQTLPDVVPIFCGAKAAYVCQTTEDVYQEAGNYYARLETVKDLMACSQTDSIVKIAIYVRNQEAEALYDQFMDMGDELAIVLSGCGWIDISNASASKGDAIRIIQERFGIIRKDSIAFGDYMNDYTLLMECEESYAMSNGHPDLKAAAKYITLSNDEDGVMRVLRKM